jgi:hypothetical protein
MHSITRVVAAAAILALAAPAAAQQQKAAGAPDPVRFGFGISIVPLQAGAGVVPPVEIYAPIAIAPQFRLEPSLGIFTANEGGTGGVDTTDVLLGIGAFFVNKLAPQVDMYMGGRLKLNFASADNGVTDDSDTDLILAAAAGGEYYFVPKFSLGLEAQLGIYDLGDVSGDVSGFFTSGLAFLRMYF